MCCVRVQRLLEFTSLSGIELRAGSTICRSLVFVTQDERNYVHQVFGFARSKNTRIHLLKEDNILSVFWRFLFVILTMFLQSLSNIFLSLPHIEGDLTHY